MPQPYATGNINFTIPADFEKLSVFGVNPLGNINISLIANWQDGAWFTYNPKNIQGLINNVQKKDFYDFTLRANKIFKFNKFKIDLFVEINNLLNSKFLNVGQFIGTYGNPQFGCFWDFQDYQAYMNSLHLPESDAYDNITGDDKIGDYRKEGVDYQPVQFYNVQIEEGKPGVIYYNRDSEEYMTYADGAWSVVDQGVMNQILADKAYIDMPNMTSFHFLNPRTVFFGVRLSFDLN